MSADARRAQRVLLAAAALSALGVAVAGTASRVGGGVILVLGWLAFVYGLHTYGRSGPASPPPADS